MSWNRVAGALLGTQEPSIGPDERALLDHVLAAPTDDAPREVYADWLQQRGDPRGELIAIELAVARAVDVDEHNRLKARDFALLEQHGHRWCARVGLGGVAEPWQGQDWHADFQRGFIEAVELRADLLGKVATRLFGHEPVRALTLVRARLGRLPEMIHLARLHTLVLRRNELGDRGVIALAASPHVANLRRLEIDANRVRAAGASAIARSPHLGRLDALALRGNELGDAGALALASMASLRTVSLESNLITAAGALALAELPNLVELDLAGNPIDTATWIALRRRLGDRVTR